MQKITPKSPDTTWLNNYFAPGLLNTPAYAIATPDVSVKLDQNESPWDWPEDLKQKILQKVAASPWNRYPEAMGVGLLNALSNYVNVPADCLLTTPGSNVMIPLILEALGRHPNGKIVIAQPCFGLFEMHCNFAGLDYELWPLDENFNYDIDALPDLPDNSLVIFASPNNPTGTVLPAKDFALMLKNHPKVMFLADEAYFEFNDEPYAELLAEYSNMMILRTMSKTMGAAGVRLGYLMASSAVIEQLRKLRLPFMLNYFALQASEAVLTDKAMREFVKQNVDNAVAERERLALALEQFADKGQFRVIPSKANFLLVQWQNQEMCDLYYNSLIEGGVLVRNMSKGPRLAACLRISTGTTEENSKLLEVITEITNKLA